MQTKRQKSKPSPAFLAFVERHGQAAAMVAGCSPHTIKACRYGERRVTARLAQRIEQRTAGEFRKEDLISWH